MPKRWFSRSANQMMVLRSILSAKAILPRFRRVRSAFTTSPSNRDAATIGTSITQKTAAVKSLSRCWSRLLSRRRQACDRNETGRLHQYSGRSQALARCGFGQLVQPFGNRSSGRADFKRVVRTGNGRMV